MWLYFNQMGLSYDYCNPIGSANVPAQIIELNLSIVSRQYFLSLKYAFSWD